MSSLDIDQLILDAYPLEYRAEMAAILGVSVDDLINQQDRLESTFVEVLRRRGELMTPEETEEWVEHLMCEYT